MANHGVMVVGATVAEVFDELYYFVFVLFVMGLSGGLGTLNATVNLAAR